MLSSCREGFASNSKFDRFLLNISHLARNLLKVLAEIQIIGWKMACQKHIIGKSTLDFN
jgi:hypothetical protein